MKITHYFSEKEWAELQEKGSEFLENFKKQQANTLYKDANFLYNRTQLKQLVKATEKYPEPLNFNSWTSDELLDHAYQELVDQSHYLTGLWSKLKKLELENAELKEHNKYWRNRYESLRNRRG